MRPSTLWMGMACALALAGCKQSGAEKARGTKVGIVTDVGGRGDQSFNDSALRGLELWAYGQHFTGTGYTPATPQELAASIPPEVAALHLDIRPLPIQPLVLQSKSQEDYEPNLQLLVDQGSKLAIGTGFMLQNAVQAVARRNPQAKFLLIDSPLLDDHGGRVTLPNVRTVVFREEEGSFLAGALAGMVTRSGHVAFVGGMRIQLIEKFEAGFRAGLQTTNPRAAADAYISYTGSFDDVAAGKQVGADVVAKGADVVFHAAGSDGLGVIQAVKEARSQGKQVYMIGVDSDQWHLAPDAVITSMVKHVDLAVYEACRDLLAGKLGGGDLALGLAQGGVGLAPFRIDFPNKAAAVAKVEQLRQQIIAGRIQVPSTPTQLAAFKALP